MTRINIIAGAHQHQDFILRLNLMATPPKMGRRLCRPWMYL